MGLALDRSFIKLDFLSIQRRTAISLEAISMNFL